MGATGDPHVAELLFEAAKALIGCGVPGRTEPIALRLKMAQKDSRLRV